MVFTVKMVGQKKYFSNFLHTEKSAQMTEKFDYWDDFCAHYSIEVSQNDSAIPVSGIQ